MDIIVPQEILPGIAFELAKGILLGMVLAWLWMLHRLWTGRSLLPAEPLVGQSDPPWGGGTTLLIFVVYVIGNQLAFEGYSLATRGLTPAQRPADSLPAGKGPGESPTDPVAEKARPGQPTGHPGAVSPPPPSPAAARPEARRLTLTEMMFVQTATNAALLILLPGLIRATSGARLRDFGLSFSGWSGPAIIGVVAILIVTPLVYVTQLSAVRLLAAFHVRPRAHPVETMLREQFSGGAAYLAFLSAVILAPILEELMFRGILQRWLAKVLNHGSQPPIPQHAPDPQQSILADIQFEPLDAGPEKRPQLAPPGSIRTTSRAGPDRLPGAAILITSVVFAAVHGPQWPAPIALFILSLAIGVVYHRTGSLIAAICMHALFNGFSTLLLLIALSGGHGAGKDADPPPIIERNARDANTKPLRHRPGGGPAQNGGAEGFFVDERRRC